MNTVTITIPIPDKVLSPNGNRAHWSIVGAAKKRQKRRASVEAFTESLGERPMWERATVKVKAFYKTNRRRDADNLIASLKSAYDGLKVAGLIADDSGLTHLPPEFHVDPKRPRIEMTITKEGEP